MKHEEECKFDTWTDCASGFSQVSSRERTLRPKMMDVGGNGSGLPVNNKQKAMLPNKSRGDFTRNPRKDSEVRRQKSVIYFPHENPASPQQTIPFC